MAFLPANPAAAGAATGYHPVPSLMSASLAPRHWRALGARLLELLRAVAAPLLSGGGPAAARPDPECLHVVLRLAWDGVVAESARAPLLQPWFKTVEALDAVVAAGAARPRGVLMEVLIQEPDAVLWLARLASSWSRLVDPTVSARPHVCGHAHGPHGRRLAALHVRGAASRVLDPGKAVPGACGAPRRANFAWPRRTS
jgi:hypothetical protein